MGRCQLYVQVQGHPRKARRPHPSPLVTHNPRTRTLEVYYGNAGIDAYHARLQEEDDFDAFAGDDHP